MKNTIQCEHMTGVRSCVYTVRKVNRSMNCMEMGGGQTSQCAGQS